LLALRPNPNIEDHPLSAIRKCLFSVLMATHHIWNKPSVSIKFSHLIPKHWLVDTCIFQACIFIYNFMAVLLVRT